MEGVWKVHGRCNANDLIGCGGDPWPMRFSLVAWKVCGRCTEGTWKVHGRCAGRCTEVYRRCVGGARKVCGRCP